MIAVFTTLIAFNVRGCFGSLRESFHHSLFQVASIITTTGFSTVDFNQWPAFSKLLLVLLMFIGASPGSTGGGIKTSTFFVIFQEIRGMCTKKTVHAFHRSISRQNVSKAFMITILSGTVVGIAVFLMCILEPDFSFMQLFFEVISAFGTVGLSTGITPDLSVAGKAVIILVMFTGRVGGVHPAV